MPTEECGTQSCPCLKTKVHRFRSMAFALGTFAAELTCIRESAACVASLGATYFDFTQETEKEMIAYLFPLTS